jgi:hypothetical protein
MGSVSNFTHPNHVRFLELTDKCTAWCTGLGRVPLMTGTAAVVAAAAAAL